MTEPFLSIIIACYNEGQHLPSSVREIESLMTTLRFPYELIFVDDCSTDNTQLLIHQLVDGREDRRYIQHQFNKGRGATVTDGFYQARGEIVGFIDIDLEVHCRYIPAMLTSILVEGYDGAIAHRLYKINFRPDNILRHFFSRGYHSLVRRFLGLPYQDTESGYKFFRRDKILPLLQYAKSPGWFWDTEIMWMCHHFGFKIKEIPCLFIRRFDKKSSVRVLRDSYNYLRELIKFKQRIKHGLIKSESLERNRT